MSQVGHQVESSASRGAQGDTVGPFGLVGLMQHVRRVPGSQLEIPARRHDIAAATAHTLDARAPHQPSHALPADRGPLVDQLSSYPWHAIGCM